MTFEITNVSGGSIPFQAYVYAWDGAEITGAALYSSAVLSVPSQAGFQPVSVSTAGALPLTPGNTYIAFFSTIGDGGSGVGGNWGKIQTPPGDSAYSNGTFEHSPTTTFAGLTQPNWLADFNTDLAFELDFSSPVATAPEPSSVLLVAAGIAGLLARRKLR
jgi:hypothetical protein